MTLRKSLCVTLLVCGGMLGAVAMAAAGDDSDAGASPAPTSMDASSRPATGPASSQPASRPAMGCGAGMMMRTGAEKCAMHESGDMKMHPGCRMSGGGLTTFTVGAGYTAETHSDSPGGAIGVQAGVNRAVRCCSRIEVGLAAGWYWLGTVHWESDAGQPQSATESVIPLFAQGIYTFPVQKGLDMYVAAGAGIYYKQLSGDLDAHSTDAGINGALGVNLKQPGGRIGWGLEGRYHFTPRNEGEGSRFLSVLLMARIP